MGSRISKLSYYLPEKILTNYELKKEFSSFDILKIENKIGIKERHIVREDETALDIAFNACKRVLQNIAKSQIDFLLFCTQSPDYLLPTSACILQNRLGLNTSIGALDFNLGCSGYIYGLALAKGLIKAEIARNVLLVTAETYTKHIYHKDKSNRLIFGDGAAATIISSEDKEYILNFVLGSDGRGMNNLIIPNGGLRRKYDPDVKEIADGAGNVTTANHLYMNGSEIFNFALEKVPIAVEQCLKENKMSLSDVDYVIFHQANKYMLDYLRKKINIPDTKFYVNMEKVGNTVSATIPIALADCIERNIIQRGSKVLLVGFGVGYSWAATIIEL